MALSRDRWFALMDGMDLPNSLTCFDDLCTAYAEKHRHYHTADHINAMLRHFDDTVDLAENPHEVELAIWFHDAIYKPFSTSNESDSADWANIFLTEQGNWEVRRERVCRLIMATSHQGEAITNDEQLIVDIDLSVLGAPTSVYEAFERNVRKEYRLVPGFIYRQKRKALLQSFLSRDHIYHLVYFQENFEQTARENIQRALHEL